MIFAQERVDIAMLKRQAISDRYVEPSRVANTIKQMGLSYSVVTSVDRDDLVDGGAGAFAMTIKQIKKFNPDCKVEVLIPDFNGNKSSLETVIKASPDVLNHGSMKLAEEYLEL